MSKLDEIDFVDFNMDDDDNVLVVNSSKIKGNGNMVVTTKKKASTHKNTAKNSSVSIRKKTRKKTPSNATVSVVSSDDENISDEEPPKTNQKAQRPRKNGPIQKNNGSASTVIIKKRNTRPSSPSAASVVSTMSSSLANDDDMYSAIANSILITHCRFDSSPVRANVVPYHQMLHEARDVLGYSGSSSLKFLHKKLTLNFGNIKKSINRIRSIYPYDYLKGYFYIHPSDALLRSVMVTRAENDAKLLEYNNILNKLGLYLDLFI